MTLMTECYGVLAFCIPALDRVCATDTCPSTSTFMPMLMWLMWLWHRRGVSTSGWKPSRPGNENLTTHHNYHSWISPAPHFLLPRRLQPLNGPSTSLRSLLERAMSEGHGAAEQAQSPVKMFLALITVPIDPRLIPAQIRLILLVASAFWPPHCTVINIGTGMARIFHTFSALSLFNCVTW